jgi:hypothetical protein
MKEGSMFCFVLFCFVITEIQPNWDALDRVLGVFGKLSMRRGAWAWFHNVWNWSVQKFLNIE